LKIYSKIMIFCLLILVLYLISGCASGPAKGTNLNLMIIDLKISDKGTIDLDGNGYYAILFNSFDQAIESTNFETYTDFIRFDGNNFSWFHRQGNVPSPGYTWVNAGNINADASVSSDNTSLVIRINLNDSSQLFNQYIESRKFTLHAITTDQQNSLLGRVIDTLGPGPSVNQNDLYTIYLDKVTGVLSPYPPGYPADNLGDTNTQSDLSADFPYDNFDIESFTVEIE
jgi:hypothetical protein